MVMVLAVIASRVLRENAVNTSEPEPPTNQHYESPDY